MPTKPPTFRPRRPKIPEQRPNAQARGYGSRWQKARLTYLREHPLCVECEAEGRVTAASVVDHIKDHKQDQTLFWDEANWQALCDRCHRAKTIRENRPR